MDELQVQVVTGHGKVDPDAQAYARHKIGQLARLAPGPVLLTRVKLERAPDPALDRPALAQATLDINGRLVRAQVAARQFDEAVDLLEARLRDRLEHLHSHLRARRRRAAMGESGEWRHGDLAARRPAWFPRPVEERAVVRHKRLALAPMSLEEAALDLELLDYDFYLFVEAETGQDALVWHRPQGALGLAVAAARLPDVAGRALSVQPAPAPPRLTIEEATGRLDLTGEPFVFFVDATTGRGGVAYRRYDGHYGLITAAGAE
ncbi:MAG TPA: sigma 54 modulation/S30EA ribosomal C-terminal domain-containing protein [Actinomycetes bacterium]|jgi:ribosome-associated translation inhibitor RaiA|nr:sigma 54 modulation/S30EA ribosomal C-terminal domain-containing protein [Actinomycetes bacterium]